MSWWSSAENRLRHLGKKAEVAVKAKQVSVVRYDEIDGVWVIDWPENPADGVLLVPRPMSEDEWGKQFRSVPIIKD